MNDETKAELMKRTREWLQVCVNAATRSGVPEEADLEAFILAHIDGEQARQDAAVAAAREEQREADAKFCPNCLGVGFVERPVPCPYCDDSTHDHYCPTGTQRQQCGCGAERIRGTPLDATPLADELRTLRAKYDELHTAAGNWLRQRDLAFDREEEVRAQLRELREIARNVADVQHLRQSSIALTDERDALRARVAELESQAADRYDCKGGAGTTAPACGGCVTCLHRVIEKAEARVAELEAERTAAGERFSRACAAEVRSTLDRAEQAEAQVAAARAECAGLIGRPWSRWAGDAGRDVLRAMDEAAK